MDVLGVECIPASLLARLDLVHMSRATFCPPCGERVQRDIVHADTGMACT